MNTNSVPRGFLIRHRTSNRGHVIHLPLGQGFLKLEYSDDSDPGVLFLVSFVLDRSDGAVAIGCRLEMSLSDDGQNDIVTYITENGVSGLQWADGGVFWGHTYEDDGGPVSVRKISLEDWVDECISKMVNPSQEEIDEYTRGA